MKFNVFMQNNWIIMFFTIFTGICEFGGRGPSQTISNSLGILMVLAGAMNIRNFTKIYRFLVFLQFPVDFTGNHGISYFPAKFWKTVPARSAPTRMCPDLEKPKELHRFWRGKSARGPSKSVQIKKYHYFRTLDDFFVKFHKKWWNSVIFSIFQ